MTHFYNDTMMLTNDNDNNDNFNNVITMSLQYYSQVLNMQQNPRTYAYSLRLTIVGSSPDFIIY